MTEQADSCLSTFVRLALFEPDIPQNTGTLLRLGACLGVPVEIVAPAGFDLSDRALRRAGLDYAARAMLTVHRDFDAFRRAAADRGGRLVAASAHAATPHHRFAFAPGDVILAGRESSGLPETVCAAADATIAIPMAAGLRSLNVAVASAILVGEALRQTGGFEAQWCARAQATGGVPRSGHGISG